jgi:hypothetical protein
MRRGTVPSLELDCSDQTTRRRIRHDDYEAMKAMGVRLWIVMVEEKCRKKLRSQKNLTLIDSSIPAEFPVVEAFGLFQLWK